MNNSGLIKIPRKYPDANKLSCALCGWTELEAFVLGSASSRARESTVSTSATISESEEERQKLNRNNNMSIDEDYNFNDENDDDDDNDEEMKVIVEEKKHFFCASCATKFVYSYDNQRDRQKVCL